MKALHRVLLNRSSVDLGGCKKSVWLHSIKDCVGDYNGVSANREHPPMYLPDP